MLLPKSGTTTFIPVRDKICLQEICGKRFHFPIHFYRSPTVYQINFSLRQKFDISIRTPVPNPFLWLLSWYLFLSKQIPTNLLHHFLRGYFLFFLPPAFSCAYRVGHPHPRYASPFPMGSLAFSQWEHPILARSEIQCCALSQQSTQEHWACRTHGEPGYSISGFPGLDQNLLDPFCAKPVFLFIVLCID